MHVEFAAYKKRGSSQNNAKQYELVDFNVFCVYSETMDHKYLIYLSGNGAFSLPLNVFFASSSSARFWFSWLWIILTNWIFLERMHAFERAFAENLW